MDAIQLNRARRMAKRNRSETACQSCKIKKARCSDFQPCRRCTELNMSKECIKGSGNSSSFYLPTTHALTPSPISRIDFSPPNQSYTTETNGVSSNTYSALQSTPQSSLSSESAFLFENGKLHLAKSQGLQSLEFDAAPFSTSHDIPDSSTTDNCASFMISNATQPGQFAAPAGLLRPANLHPSETGPPFASMQLRDIEDSDVYFAGPTARRDKHNGRLDAASEADGRGDWAWEAAPGPGEEDPFRNDWPTRAPGDSMRGLDRPSAPCQRAGE